MAKNKALWLSIVLIVVVIATASAVEAQQGPRTTMGKIGWWIDTEVQSTLQLSPEQIAKIEAIEADFGPRIKKMVQRAGVEYQATLALLKNKKIDEEEYAEQQKKVADAYGERIAEAVAHWKALRDVLNEQQWLTLREEAPQVFRLGGWRMTAGRKTVNLGPAENAE